MSMKTFQLLAVSTENICTNAANGFGMSHKFYFCNNWSADVSKPFEELYL